MTSWPLRQRDKKIIWCLWAKLQLGCVPNSLSGIRYSRFGRDRDPPGRAFYAVEAKINAAHAPFTEATIAWVKDRYKLIHNRGYKDYHDQYELYDLERS